MECPVCEYPNSKLKYRLSDRFFHTTTDEFELYDCSSCGLLFQDVASVEKRIEEFYPAGYWWKGAGRLSKVEAFYREWMIRHDQLKFLQSVSPPSPGKRLLDIGCGSGLFVRLARDVEYSAYGLDSSAEAISEARLSGAKSWFFEGEIDQLIEQGEKFAVVTLFHTLEHLTDPFRFLRRLHQLLEKPGALIVQVPNRASWQAKVLGRRWYGLDCPRHLHNYSTHSLLHLMGRAGYRLHRLNYVSVRDNAPALVSSIFPGLDPLSQKVRNQGGKARVGEVLVGAKEVLYATLVSMAQPLAWLEAKLGRGATVKVFATLE